MIFLSEIQKEKPTFFLNCFLILKHGADRVSRKVGKELPLHAA